MKIIVCDSHIISGHDFSVEREIIEKAGHELVLETCRNEDDIIEHCPDADVLLDIVLRIGERSIRSLRHCIGIVRYGIGVDEIDMDAATGYGIKVCNVSRYCMEEVALHVTALALACCRQLPRFDACVRGGMWNRDLGRAMARPSSQTVGILGFGNIGRAIAKNFLGLGFNVVACDPYLPDEVFSSMNVRRVDYDELYAVSDIIVPQLHLTAETENIINKDSIARMKDGVIIVNCSRGPLINEADFCEAVRSGKIAAAGIDVMREEPMFDPDHPYCSLPNVILTPHQAYNSVQSSYELFRQVAETAVALANGETPYNVLNAARLRTAR